MKSHPFRALVVAAILAVPAIAYAHPGHDGDHELVWDFDHFVEHPFATLACAAVVVGAGWLAWRAMKSAATAKAERSKRE